MQNNVLDNSILVAKETDEANKLLLEKLSKESKKITRIPFYKLENLKRIEEKKLKNIHKNKKKEIEELKPHFHIKVSGKKPKMTKKQKDEAKLLKKSEVQNANEEKSEQSLQIAESASSKKMQNSGIINKSNPNIAEGSFCNIPSPLTSNQIKELKYKTNINIPNRKRLKLSKKQQALQYPEYALSNFLSHEDKAILSNIVKGIKGHHNIKNKRYLKETEQRSRFNSKEINSNKEVIKYNDFNKESFFTNENENNSFNGSFQFEKKNLTLNNSSIIQTPKRVNLSEQKEESVEEKKEELTENRENQKSFECINKKRKRLTKYKKAIYKSRLEKKKRLYDLIFNQNEEEEENNNNNNINASQKNIQNNDQVNKEDNIKINQDTFNQNYYTNSNVPQRDFNHSNYQIPNSLIMNYYNYNTIDNNNTNLNYNQYQPLYPCYWYNNEYLNQTNTFYQSNPYQYNGYNYNYSNIQPEHKNKFSFEYVLDNTNQKLNTFYNKNLKYNSISNNNINNNNKNTISVVDYQKTLQNKPVEKFSFEKPKEPHSKKDECLDKFKSHLKEFYDMENKDFSKMNGKDLNEFIQKHKGISKLNFNQLKTILPESEATNFLNKYEGVQNPSQKKIIREYVDQILDKQLDTLFSAFIEKLRDLYYKKKQIAPLKAKKRFVVGMREIEKYIRLKEIKCLFVVPNIEKVTGEKNSLDDRLLKIFELCRGIGCPIVFGLNKFKLGKIARKKNSCISMLGVINVEGFENELKNLIIKAENLRKEWYIKNYEQKEKMISNKYISQNLFEVYYNGEKSNQINS